jgi:hypothetical protein
MTLTAHIAIGSAVGLATGNPVAAFLCGWISHHFADATPHSDPGSFGIGVKSILSNTKGLKMVFLDIVISIIVFAVFVYKSNYSSLVFWGSFGGVFPDLIDNSPFWSLTIRKYFPFNIFHLLHKTVHCTIKQRRYLWFGVLTQIILITVSFCYLFLWWK